MKAADVMTTDVVSVEEDAPISKAVRLMLENRISGLPVVNRAGALVGIVTEGDFLRRAETGTVRRRPNWLEFLVGPGRLAAEYTHTHGRKVSEVMTAEVTVVDAGASLEEVVRVMESRRIKRVPVARDGKLAGIISRANLLRALTGTMGEPLAPATDDATIRDRVCGEINAVHWASQSSIDVMVRDGVVHLAGSIFDERERTALKVIAENVPGVKSVEDHLVWIEPVPVA